MKFKLVFLLAVALCAACSSDNADFETPSLVGEWKLFSVKAPQPIDLNQDGQPSTQLLAELPCFMDDLTVQEEGTFTRTATALNVVPVLDPPGISASCSEETITTAGTWELDDDQLTFMLGGRSQTTTITLTKFTLAFTDVNPVFGPLDLVFIRQ